MTPATRAMTLHGPDDSTAGPTASVVVPTHERPQRLARLMAALSAQTGVGPFEVIVVDDASTDDTWDRLVRWERSLPFRLRPLRLERNAGPAAARNLGWQEARAQVVAFIDDDCVPSENWLATLVEEMAGAEVVQGRTQPDPAQLGRHGPFSQTVDIPRPGLFETCNIAYSRQLLVSLGGFDPRYRYPYGEDVDLGWRAKKAGARTDFAPDAVVYHDVSESSFLRRLRSTRRLEGGVLALRCHPELRPVLHRRIFFRRSHPPALVALAGIVLAVHRGGRPAVRIAGVAAMLLYAHFRVRGEPLVESPLRRITSMPAALVVDLAEIASLASASIRYRTLVL